MRGGPLDVNDGKREESRGPDGLRRRPSGTDLDQVAVARKSAQHLTLIGYARASTSSSVAAAIDEAIRRPTRTGVVGPIVDRMRARGCSSVDVSQREE